MRRNLENAQNQMEKQTVEVSKLEETTQQLRTSVEKSQHETRDVHTQVIKKLIGNFESF